MEETKQQDDLVIEKDEATSPIETTLAPKVTCSIPISSNVLLFLFLVGLQIPRKKSMKKGF